MTPTHRSFELLSHRTGCRSPLANQVRLVLHIGAYWLMLKVRLAHLGEQHPMPPRTGLGP
jgi:hypothetical protein